MKVLVLASYTRSLITFRGDLIRDMIANGHTVITCAPEEDDTGEIARLGTRFVQLPFLRAGINLLAEIKLMADYKQLFLREKPDVVFCYTIKPNVYGPPSAKGTCDAKIYIMVTGIGNAFLSGNGLKGAFLKTVSKALYRHAIQCCERVIFQNPDDRNDFLSMGLVKPEQIELVNGSGVNLTYFQAGPLPEQPVFLMIARLLREKGVFEYLEACRLLRKSGSSAICALLGPYEQRENAITPEDIQPYIDDKSVVYWGETRDVRPFLAKCSVLVLPSYREGTPRSILEAMACGRAVIASDVPGCRETVEHGTNGYLVPAKQPAALADAMKKLVDSPETIAQMGQESLNICRTKYDVQLVNREMLHILGLNPANNEV
ncbi:MAG: glycosyltransferase family 4 protein [Bacillota bacterium]